MFKTLPRVFSTQSHNILIKHNNLENGLRSVFLLLVKRINCGSLNGVDEIIYVKSCCCFCNGFLLQRKETLCIRVHI